MEEPSDPSMIPLYSKADNCCETKNAIMCEDLAIEVSQVHKKYGRGNKKTLALKDFSMSIPKGKIYGLLGPSGCGKTTLLQCLAGKLSVDHGQVFVFGSKPGSRDSLVPGPSIGYMPQELALYGEFTIKETLQYFGRLFNMTSDKVSERTDFLIKFLDLPDKWALIMNLSGGQQRRASLAVALLHEPKLIVLDEPTVGVDPILRQTIWNHLVYISASTSATIIITTHYIEEARQAHMVGMMRSGQLLAEDTPSNLLNKLEMDSLENVFLNLCRKDGEVDRLSSRELDTHRPNCVKVDAEQDGHLSDQNSRQLQNNRSRKKRKKEVGGCRSMFKLHRMHALLVKNFIRMWRNLGFLIFQFILPTIQVSLFCLAIGRDPAGMSIAVVNEEIGSSACSTWDSGCLISVNSDWVDNWDIEDPVKKNFSCRYLSHVDPEVLELVYFNSYDEAYEQVRQAKHWGLIHFTPNYTDALIERLTTLGGSIMAHVSGIGSEPEKLPDDTIYQSTIHIYLDMTNQQVGYAIQLKLAEAFKKFTTSVLESCNVDTNTTSVPMKFETPVYGNNDPTFTEFMAPGVILSITFFMAVGLTSISFIIERREGLLDRSWIAGVTSVEVMLAHVVAQFVVMVVQASLVLIFMILVFEVPARGPIIWVVSLTILQGTCGMAFGLVISALCDNEHDAIQLALGSFYPNLLLSGIIWPLEGMPKELRYISYVLPQTFACKSMRGILSRGWGLEWEPVYLGFVITIVWTILLLILSSVILKIRR